MSSIDNKFEELEKEKTYSSAAKRIMENLKPILSKSKDLSKRWIWELLQNATDYGENILAEVEISDSELCFRHNGKPFTLSDAFNLVRPDSDKDDEDFRNENNKNPPIGQFGTGFLSTHILSKHIRIKGVIQEEKEEGFYNFNFGLDRSDKESKTKLMEAVEVSEKEYKNSLNEISLEEKPFFSAEFCYSIEKTYDDLIGNQIVDDGLEALEALIPFVFAFRPQLDEVKIIDHRKDKVPQITYTNKILESSIKNIKIVKTICSKKGDVEKTENFVCTTEAGKTELAVKVKPIDGKRYKIEPYPESTPSLYCAFPMVGENSKIFPFILNSEYFVPDKERDGVEISKYDEENRSRFKEGVEAFDKLLSTIEENQWEASYYLFSLSKIEFSDNDTQEWFKENIFDEIVRKLRSKDIVKDLQGTYQPLKRLYFPYVDKRLKDSEELMGRLFEVAKTFYSNELPSELDVKKWYRIINFEVFENEKLDLKELIRQISKMGSSLDECKEKLKLEESGIIESLKKLITIVSEQEEIELLNKYAIIPNQLGEFVFQKKLKTDHVEHEDLKEGYDEKLKQIEIDLTGSTCKTFLINNEFATIPDIVNPDEFYTLEDLADTIDKKMQKYDGSYKDKNFINSLKNIFHWYSSCGIIEDELNKMLSYFSENKPLLFFNTKDSEELESAFDIQLSGKGKVLSRIARSDLSEKELEMIAANPSLVTDFMNWLNHKVVDNPDKEIGDIGEEFLYSQLCQNFGEERVLWENKREYDFRVLDADFENTKYFIDAKTTSQGISNEENVPFFMRRAQWDFLENSNAYGKYVIARVYKTQNEIGVKFLKINLSSMN